MLDTEFRNLIVIVVIFVSFIPLGLVLLEFISSRRGVIDLKGFKIDFSKIDLNQPDVQRVPFGIPDNIGVSGAIISDTSPMKIISALKKATANEIVLVDIKDGNSWWVTRLLALSAGAVRAGSPKAFVFMGIKEKRDGMFLGWAEPVDIQKAILDGKADYRDAFLKSMRIARQTVMFGATELIPSGIILQPEVTRYTSDPEYSNLGDAAFEQILMDQLGKSYEFSPDRLTLGRLKDLFEHCLYRNVIDLSWPNEKQISELLDSHAPYIALLRNGKYVNMIKRDDGDRLIIRELFLQSQKGK